MRILLVWPANDPETGILIDELQKGGHAVVYWVGERAIEPCNPKGSIFHDHYDAWDAVRAAKLKDKEIPPADPRLIEEMYTTESLILTMMNKRYDSSPVDERKHVYYTMLAYWNYVLETVKPDAVIYNTVPHSIYSNVIYDLAKRRGIRTLMFEETWVGGRLMFYRDFWKGSDEVREALEKARAHKVEIADLHPDLRDYYGHQTNPRSVKTPWYMKDQSAIGAGAGLWAHRARIALSSPHLILSRAYRLLKRTLQADLRSEYQTHAQPVDLKKPYIYFPLNFQPERTTSPQGGIFHDQILAVETLAEALPEGWKIYVKEHPSQWWLRGKTRFSSARYPGYYARLARIPRVQLVPIHDNTFTLTDNAKLVATITGTAGWEAIMRRKYVLVFGIPWYRDCPGALLVRSMNDCKAAIANAEGKQVSRDDVLAFLKVLGEQGTRAHLVRVQNVTPEISMTASMRAITEKLLVELAR